jgi:hypothetical protein
MHILSKKHVIEDRRNGVLRYQAFSHPSRLSHDYESPRSSEAFRLLGNIIDECVADRLNATT